MHWVNLAIAVVANTLANVSLKVWARQADFARDGVIRPLLNPWALAFVLSCMVLLGAYIYALRQISLSTAYAVVTSGALVLITTASVLFLGERILPIKVAGIVCVLFGIFLLVRAETASTVAS